MRILVLANFGGISTNITLQEACHRWRGNCINPGLDFNSALLLSSPHAPAHAHANSLPRSEGQRCREMMSSDNVSISCDVLAVWCMRLLSWAFSCQVWVPTWCRIAPAMDTPVPKHITHQKRTFHYRSNWCPHQDVVNHP